MSLDLERIAENYATSQRSPITHTPTERGLEFEDVTFPAEDGLRLAGWFVPAEGAETVIVVNHPRWFSRSGLPSHREPWRSIAAAFGNDFEVDFIPDIALLHEAGYHVLAYDLRNFGESAGEGGPTTGGQYESRDVVGSLRYVRSRPDLCGAKIALFSRCLGANATFFAMERAPAEFDDVRCLVACQPLSPCRAVEKGVPAEAMAKLDELIRQRTGFGLDDMSPVRAARAARTPTFVYQVRDDAMTEPSDVQAIFDALPAPKELHWITGTTQRWDGYLDFQRQPSRILTWLTRYAS